MGITSKYDQLNSIPEITSECNIEAIEDIEYTCQITAIDNDPEDTLAFSLQQKPDGMEISDAGLITWTPNDAQAITQKHGIITHVSDSKHTVSYEHVINVERVNDPHKIITDCDDFATEDQEYSCQIKIFDEEEDAIISTFAIGDAPEGMEISKTGLITWTPVDSQTGNNLIKILVADAQGVTNKQFVIFVEPVNDAPKFLSTCEIEAIENVAYSCDLLVEDEEGDELEFKILEGPGEIIDDQFSFLAKTDLDAGEHFVKFQVSDGEKTDVYEFTLNVAAVNDAPKFYTERVLTNATEDVYYLFPLSAEDEENNEFIFSLEGQPNGMNISPDTGEITWTPEDTDAHVGDVWEKIHTFKVKITEVATILPLETSKEFDLKVIRTNKAPEFNTSVILTDATENVEYTFNSLKTYVEDQENDEFKFYKEQGPDDLEVDPDDGTLSWNKPEDADAYTQGNPAQKTYPIIISIEETKENGLSTTANLSLTVKRINNAPEIIGHNCKPVTYVMSSYYCTIEINDEESSLSDSELTYSLDGAPDLMTFDDGNIEYNASSEHFGSYTFTVKVTDNFIETIHEVESTFTIDLNVLNNPAYGYAMLGYRLKGKQFLNSVIHGKVGQISTDHNLQEDSSSSKAIFYDNIVLNSKFSLDFIPDYAPPQIKLRDNAEIIENAPEGALPTEWPAILDSDSTEPAIDSSILTLAENSEGEITGGRKWIIPTGTQFDPESEPVESIDYDDVNGHAILMGWQDSDEDDDINDDYFTDLEYGEMGCLNISGTLNDSSPTSTVDGVIVIDGDLIIRGEICGKGAIYVKRNIYIVDNLTYNNSPDEPFINGDEINFAGWESVKTAEKENGDSYDKLELYAGGNILFGNIALYNAGYHHLKTWLNHNASGVIPAYDDILDEPYQRIYDRYADRFCGGIHSDCNLLKPLSEYQLLKRELECSLFTEERTYSTDGTDIIGDCVLGGALRFRAFNPLDPMWPTCDTEAELPSCNPKGLYAFDGEHGERSTTINSFAGFDDHETSYASNGFDYDGDGLDSHRENTKPEGGSFFDNILFDKEIVVETAGLFPLGSQLSTCTSTGNITDDFCFDDSGWIHASIFSELAGFGDKYPGYVNCDYDDPANPDTESVLYRIRYNANDLLRPEETYLPQDNECFGVGNEDYCEEGASLCKYPIPTEEEKALLYCWIETCAQLGSYFTVRCNDDDVPPLQKPGKASKVYSLLYAEGAVTGYKKGNARFYDENGKTCAYTCPGSDNKKYEITCLNCTDSENKNGHFGFMDDDNDGLTFYGAILARDIDVYVDYGGWYVMYDDRNAIDLDDDGHIDVIFGGDDCDDTDDQIPSAIPCPDK